MKRRDFLTAGGTVAAGLAASSLAAPAVAKGNRELKMVMPWPKGAPGVGVNAQRIADLITTASDGRLKVTLYGGGELVPPFECFDAVQGGAADMAHGTPYYWGGKNTAFNYFTTVPFGMTATEMASWLRFGGGQELWDEAYGSFGLKGFYAGSSGVQTAGWFNKEITKLDDLKGLKMRIAGLGGEAMRRLGVSVVMMPPGEIFGAMQSGAVDAAEWVGPWNDLAFGLYKTAKYYYMPAFHEPGPALEVFMRQEMYQELPSDLQAIVKMAVNAGAMDTLSDFTYHNITSLKPLVEGKNVEVRDFPDEVVSALGDKSMEIIAETAEKDDLSRRIDASVRRFVSQAVDYADLIERPMLRQRSMVWKKS